jgi:hypothetical protein
VISVVTLPEARAEALFCSTVQPSDKPGAVQVGESIAAMIRVHGSRGCACQVAAAFGDHPDVALERMRWARDTVAATYPRRKP